MHLTEYSLYLFIFVQCDKLIITYVKLQICCMVIRVNLDCSGCCRKMRRILLNMKEVESHAIDKQQCKVMVCGRIRPSDVAIKVRKKMNRRVEILEIQELNEGNEQEDQQ
ncbi:heavy metal-associated isoprenylated plant protein 26 [Mangifera indica]|uniref:heavy metal-associated isoprenylated plant protein 26 n=1 Tax=Mangifera indica TaxID=29780 RepID=UPI001CF9B8E1|nr:heavy metal-associated isoprenylated plant protein 26 [Mangifera indica]